MKPSLRWKNFSLRTKLTLLIEGLVVTVVLVTGIFTTMREKEALEGELQNRGLALATDLAQFASRPVLIRDLPTLRRFVKHSMGQDYVLYVMLLDFHGKAVMHSDLAMVGETLDDSLSISAMSSPEPGCIHVSASGERHCDIFAPIKVSDIRLGTVRLGYSYRAVEKEIDSARNQILLIGVATASLGGILAYLLAGFISAPIKRITSAIKKVADGNLKTALTINSNDEVGALAESFNKMTADLRKTTISKDYVDNIIGSMNETLIVVDPEGGITSVNRATCELLGYQEVELAGKEIDLIVAGEKKFFDAKTIESLPGRGTLLNHEVNYVTSTGRHIPMLLSTAILRNREEKVVGIVGVAKNIEQRKRSEEALKESERQLRFLSSKLLTVQEEERKRLSAELHDELGQALVLFKIQLRSIQGRLKGDQAQLKGECDELIGYINEVSENVRRLARDLSPAILEDLGFLAAIRRLADGFAKQFHVKVSADDTEDLLSKEAQIIAYRIIQECFTNVAKHSQAKNVSVVIWKQDGQLAFRVEDDGIGFNVKEVLEMDANQKGLGLAAMLERARILKGFCEIRSEDRAGTVVTCTIPIDHGGGRT